MLALLRRQRDIDIETDYLSVKRHYD